MTHFIERTPLIPPGQKPEPIHPVVPSGIPQREITREADLLDADGFLRERGWARRPLLRYNPETIRVAGSRALGRLRLKEWDYYGFTTPDFFFSAAVSHAGYIGVVFAYLIDFRTREQWEDTLVTPFGAGVRLPRTSKAGDVIFQKGLVRFAFRRGPNRREIEVRWPAFAKGEGLDARWSVEQGDEIESVVMATPMPGRAFYYNEKINCMPAAGSAKVGRRVYESATAFATLDWGRGVWPYRTFWNWGSASGRLTDGRRLGLNLGRGFGDLSAATENVVFVEGRAHKLGDVMFDYDPRDFMKPWRFYDDNNRLRLTLTPIFDRATVQNYGVVSSVVHQMFGRYDGYVITDDGERVEIRNLTGWAEEHQGRW